MAYPTVFCAQYAYALEKNGRICYTEFMDDFVGNLLANTRPAWEKYNELQAQLVLPETAADGRLYRYLAAKAQALQPWAEAHVALQTAQDALRANRAAMAEADAAMLPLYRDEQTALHRALCVAVDNVQALLAFGRDGGELPCTLTIRPDGRDGIDFAATLVHIYAQYLAQSHIECTQSEDGKVYSLSVGAGGYGRLRSESGTHKCVQGGAATVAVMPVQVPTRVEIADEDIRVDIFCSSGKGGQNVNKVETAVRITHLPTGTVVTCQDERSQLANRRRAMQRLAERLQSRYDALAHADYVAKRDSQTRDRSNAVRVYDEAQNKVRDTRCRLQIPYKEAKRGHIHPLIVAVALHNYD